MHTLNSCPVLACSGSDEVGRRGELGVRAITIQGLKWTINKQQ